MIRNDSDNKENKKSKNFRKNEPRSQKYAKKEANYRQKCGIKKRKKHLSKESRPRRTILGNSNPSFGPERGQGTRAAPCSKWCCVRSLSLFTPFFFAPASFLSLPLSVFLRDWSANPVIHRKHRMQTVTWVVGSKVLRGRARGKRGRKTGVRVCACCGARQFTAYILAAFRRVMQRVDAEVLLFRHHASK